jgi:hypothetical protein
MPPPRRRCPPHPPTGHIQACHAPAPVSCLPQALAAAARLRPRTAGDEAVHPWSPPLPPPTETLRPAWPSAPPAGTSPNRACGVGCAIVLAAWLTSHTHVSPSPRLPPPSQQHGDFELCLFGLAAWVVGGCAGCLQLLQLSVGLSLAYSTSGRRHKRGQITTICHPLCSSTAPGVSRPPAGFGAWRAISAGRHRR